MADRHWHRLHPWRGGEWGCRLRWETRFAAVTSPTIGAIALAATNAVGFGVQGAAVGIAQWIALRRYLARSGWWVVATTGGWAVAGMMSGVLGGAFGGSLTGVGPEAGPIGIAVTFVGGIAAVFFLPGIMQWVVLRRQVGQAGWWVLAHAGSLFVATLISFPVMVLVAGAAGWSLPSAQAWGFGGALSGPLDGAITGAVLVLLLRRPVAGPISEDAHRPQRIRPVDEK